MYLFFTGNTWTIECLYLLMTNGDFETAKNKSFMERTFFLELIPDANSTGDNADATMAKAQQETAGDRLLKTHVHYRHIQKQVSTSLFDIYIHKLIYGYQSSLAQNQLVLSKVISTKPRWT